MNSWVKKCRESVAEGHMGDGGRGGGGGEGGRPQQPCDEVMQGNLRVLNIQCDAAQARVKSSILTI